MSDTQQNRILVWLTPKEPGNLQLLEEMWLVAFVDASVRAWPQGSCSQWETGLHREDCLAETPEPQQQALLSLHFPSTEKVLPPTTTKWAKIREKRQGKGGQQNRASLSPQLQSKQRILWEKPTLLCFRKEPQNILIWDLNTSNGWWRAWQMKW